MTRHPHRTTPVPGHVLVPAAAIGGLSLALVIGLEVIGLLDVINQWLAAGFSRGGMETFPNRLPVWCMWLVAAVFPFSLAFAMLATPGHPKRAVLWLTAVVLLGSWGPVLSLAAYAPTIAGPWIATCWAGFCAMVHASRHLMPSASTPPATRR